MFLRFKETVNGGKIYEKSTSVSRKPSFILKVRISWVLKSSLKAL